MSWLLLPAHGVPAPGQLLWLSWAGLGGHGALLRCSWAVLGLPGVPWRFLGPPGTSCGCSWTVRDVLAAPACSWNAFVGCGALLPAHGVLLGAPGMSWQHVEWYHPEITQQISYFAKFVWYPGVHQGQMGIFIIASTPESTVAESVSEMEVFHCIGMPSRFLPRDQALRLGIVRDVYQNMVYPSDLHDFMRSLGISDDWDGMCGFAMQQHLEVSRIMLATFIAGPVPSV